MEERVGERFTLLSSFILLPVLASSAQVSFLYPPPPVIINPFN